MLQKNWGNSDYVAVADDRLGQRKQKRWNLSRPLKIIDKKTGRHIGNITDITTAGMGMVSKYHFDSNADLELKIDLTDEDIPLNEIELKAKNVWSEEKLINRYFSGLEFTDRDKDLEYKIKNLIFYFGFIA